MIRKRFIFLCTDWLTITRTTPHSRSTGWGSKPNSYSVKATAYQSPLLAGETLSWGSYCSEMLPSHLGLLWSQFGSSGVHLWTQLMCHYPRKTIIPEYSTKQRLEILSIRLFLRNKCFRNLFSVWSIDSLEVDSSELPNNRLNCRLLIKKWSDIQFSDRRPLNEVQNILYV